MVCVVLVHLFRQKINVESFTIISINNLKMLKRLVGARSALLRNRGRDLVFRTIQTSNTIKFKQNVEVFRKEESIKVLQFDRASR